MFRIAFVMCLLFGLIAGTNAQEGYYLLGVVTWTLLAFGAILPVLIVLWIVGWFASTKQAADTIHSGTVRVRLD